MNKLKTAVEDTAAINEVNNTSSINSGSVLMVKRDNDKTLTITSAENKPPVYVDPKVIKWFSNAILNLSTVTVVPYNTKGKSYLYFIAERDGVVETKGTYVDNETIEMVLNSLNGVVTLPLDYLQQKQEVNDTDNFQMALLRRLKNEHRRFQRKSDKTINDVTYFRGSYQFSRGKIQFNMPLIDSLKEFIDEHLTINKVDFFNA